MVYSGNIAFLFCGERTGLRNKFREIGGMKQKIAADPVLEIPQGTGTCKSLLAIFFPVNGKKIGIQSNRLRKRRAVIQYPFRNNFTDPSGNNIQSIIKHFGIGGNTVLLIIHDPKPRRNAPFHSCVP